MTVEPYDLMRMSHFVNKLELLIDNCPQKSPNEDSQMFLDKDGIPIRVSIPKHQTKDAIEQLKLHIEKLIENERINKK